MNGHKKILLNLREVIYIDSSGVGELVSSLTTVRNAGGQLHICKASDHVCDVLRLTRLDTVLNFDKDEPRALQPFFQRRSAGNFRRLIAAAHPLRARRLLRA